MQCQGRKPSAMTSAVTVAAHQAGKGYKVNSKQFEVNEPLQKDYSPEVKYLRQLPILPADSAQGQNMKLRGLEENSNMAAVLFFGQMRPMWSLVMLHHGMFGENQI
ncbi:hypothetical protein AMECASPLE_023892 [Ameca splendens]|uniref:Uncharacterized protein n=1 Tax=Ameca splendens TaxID=208324 RepID=A0ABV0YF97_9TELE